MVWIATHRDLFLYGGLQAAAWSPDAREASRVFVQEGIFECEGHGFVGGEPVRVVAAQSGSLPSALSPLAWYTVAAPVTGDDPDRFSLLLNGAPVRLTDAGMGAVYVKENVLPRIDAEMAATTSYVIANAKAYKGPWTNPPLWAPRLAAHIAAPNLVDALRVSTTRYDVASVRVRGVAAEAFIVHLRSGEPMTDGTPNFDATTTPDNAATAQADMPPTLWRSGTL